MGEWRSLWGLMLSRRERESKAPFWAETKSPTGPMDRRERLSYANENHR